jgi:hypothetical protein
MKLAERVHEALVKEHLGGKPLIDTGGEFGSSVMHRRNFSAHA